MAVPTQSRRTSSGVSAQPFWLSPSSYWNPRHFPESAWIAHAPFAAWLVAAMRPTAVIELGTHRGFSCFAFAEAAQRLGLDTVVHALDSWEGDDHAGFYGEDVYESVRAIAASSYPESIRLVRGYFNRSRSQFEDRSADILHIDGRHGYEDVVEDYTEWISTVREGGVVLFHDIAETGNGFGVWRFWEELAEPGRSFTFHHGHGLGVLAVGAIAEGPVADLLSADEPTAERIRADFVRLGEIVSRQAWLESLPGELETVWAEVRQRAAHENDLEESLREHSRLLAELQSSTSWRVTAPLRSMGRVLRRRT